jgi:hypothetical protein
MLNTSVHYQKSAKGSQAIAARDHSLTPKLRSLLILVDGKRGLDELSKLSTAGADAEPLLDQLLEMGLIEESSRPAPDLAPSSAPAPLAAGPASIPPGMPLTLAEAQRLAVRRLTDVLGPTAEDLCLRIEGTRNPQEFMAAVKRAEAVLREFKGAEAADKFAGEMQARRPA